VRANRVTFISARMIHRGVLRLVSFVFSLCS
jgi:hypothetical protein